MNKIFRNTVKKITAQILLGLFVFSFLHSELGFLNNEDDNQACNNYCEIIKYADIHSKILKEELTAKLKHNKDIFIQCFEELEAQATQTSFGRADHHFKAIPPIDLYLFNSTFLI